ncbi:SRPBCC family protein [Microbacterium sp. SS28]|uniref:SRPBCC family protein n=1 Tax=Microbacterium sp. SS28 TaxID=2919948 RepID=UPI001FAA259B|nr:SRPBCC family protein [Microbacterium sp. SS28]
MSSDTKRQYRYSEEASARLTATAEEVFTFLDDHRSIAVHMGAGRSPMMGGGEMALELDAGGGREVGSHIRMTGTAFGLKLALDQVVVERTPPTSKAWQTVSQRLIVIGAYAMGFRIEPAASGTQLTVWIRYDAAPNRVLGLLGGRMYARWCVRQMRDAAAAHFRPELDAAGRAR